MHKPDAKVVFRQSANGLYFHSEKDRASILLNDGDEQLDPVEEGPMDAEPNAGDTQATAEESAVAIEAAVAANEFELPSANVVSTITANREGFTKREYQRAKKACRVYAMVGRPSPRDFMNMIRSNLIPNCPVTPYDVRVADKIFAPNVGALKGKMVQRKPSPVELDVVHVPPEIKSELKNITVAINIMFVNEIPFLVSVSRRVKFTTVERLTSRSGASLLKSIIGIKIYMHKMVLMLLSPLSTPSLPRSE